jgi:hypothetical protein
VCRREIKEEGKTITVSIKRRTHDEMNGVIVYLGIGRDGSQKI